MAKTKLPIFFLISIFSIAYLFLILRLHYNFSTTDSDLAMYSQHTWFLSQGKFLAVGQLKPFNVFGDHFVLPLLFIAPLYKLFPSSIILIVFQTLAVTLSAYPIYLLAKKILRQEFTALFLTTIYLLFYGFQAAIIFPFHGATLSVLPLSWLLWSVFDDSSMANKSGGHTAPAIAPLSGAGREARPYSHYCYWIFLFLSLICKEDIAVVTGMLGLYLVLFRRNYKRGATTILISIVYFSLVVYQIMPFFAGRKYSYLSFGQFGKTPLAILTSWITRPDIVIKTFFTPVAKVKTMLTMFASFGFLPLFSPSTLFISIPLFIERFLSPTPQRWMPWMHYGANTAPFLAIASIYGLANIRKLLGKAHLYSNKFWNLLSRKSMEIFMLLLTFLGTIASISIYNMPILKLLQPSFYKVPDVTKPTYQALKLIPKNTSVTTQSGLLAHLSERDILYLYPDPAWPSFDNQGEDLPTEAKPEDYNIPPADYILLSVHTYHWRPASNEEFQEIIKFVKKQENYQVVFEEGETVLLRRTM